MKSLRPIQIDLGSQSYEVRFEPLQHLPERMKSCGLSPGNCVVVTDKTVAHLHLSTLNRVLGHANWTPTVAEIPPGEASKSFTQLLRLQDFVLDSGVDRSTPLVAFGGGVVGDLAGFCAATVMRGIPLVHVPTTLVGQVDSSIGGKTAINHPSGKNLIGAFYQPCLVLADTGLLTTLPEREWNAGLAEVVKHALIRDRSLVRELHESWSSLRAREEVILPGLLHSIASVKARIVASDLLEKGPRSYLNLGHTVGHALEQATCFQRYLHGEAVAAGLVVALRVSQERQPDVDWSEAWALVRELEFERPADVTFDLIRTAMGRDKKNVAGQRRFVLLRDIGHPEVVSDVTTDEIESAWNWMLMS